MNGQVQTAGKAKNFLTAIKKLFTYNPKYYPYLIASIFLSIMSATLSIIAPNQISKLTNVIQEGILNKIDFSLIKELTFSLLIIYLCSMLFDLLEEILMARISNKISYELRKDISVKINRLPLSYFDTHALGDILSRITNDVDNINQTFNNSIGNLVSATMLFLGSIIMMFYTNFLMAIVAILSASIGFIFMVMILRKSQSYFQNRQQKIGELNGYIEDIYSNHTLVLAYNGKKENDKVFNQYNEEVFQVSRISQFLSGLMMPIMEFIGDLGYVAVCVVGAYLTMNKTISFGVVIAFIMYVKLFTSPLRQIAQGINQLQSTAASSERVFEFLEVPEMPKEIEKTLLPKEKVKGNITFEHVKFGYRRDNIIISDFNIEVHKGQMVAIVGPTGAGKTTLVNLLMKFYEIQEGDIIIDGFSIHDLTRKNIHDLFVMVLQDTWVFRGTVRENICYNTPKITDEEILKVCNMVGLTHFIDTLPYGLDSMIEENDNISGGQKQLITIARGILKNAPLLILDEATSNVDTRTEKIVQEAMEKLVKGKTSFVIAHRLSTIRNADIILVMKDGNIVETGTHDQLLAKNGFYKEIYQAQFQSQK